MNPYFFLYYCAFAMARKLAAKNWSDRVPTSATNFVNVIVFLAAGSILYYFGGPPQREIPTIVKCLAITLIIGAVNDFIFLDKDKYKTIVEYYDTKYISRPPWIVYWIIPMCFILLFYIIGLIHDHYGDYYRINGLK